VLGRFVSAVYLVLEDDGVVDAVFEGVEVVLDGVLAGADAGGEAGVEGAVDVVWSDVLGAASFFSPVAGVGASLPEEGFILSE
jgi:type IV secretory pathway VirB10-like protein